MTTHVWYLDVDGVLNALNPADIPDEFRRGQTINGYQIHWDTRVVDFINRMNATGKVEIVWLTTWEQDAADMIAPALGLPEFRVVLNNSGRKFSDSDWWKFASLRQDIATDERKIIWTDDDIKSSMMFNSVLEYWARETRNQTDLLLVSPNTYRALTLEALEAIEAFIDGEPV